MEPITTLAYKTIPSQAWRGSFLVDLKPREESVGNGEVSMSMLDMPHTGVLYAVTESIRSNLRPRLASHSKLWKDTK